MEKVENWDDLEAAEVVELSSDDQKDIAGGYRTVDRGLGGRHIPGLTTNSRRF